MAHFAMESTCWDLRHLCCMCMMHRASGKLVHTIFNCMSYLYLGRLMKCWIVHGIDQPTTDRLGLEISQNRGQNQDSVNRYDGNKIPGSNNIKDGVNAVTEISQFSVPVLHSRAVTTLLT